MTMHWRYISMAFVCTALVSCSTAESARTDDATPTDNAERPTDGSTFADDPIGVAFRWTDELPESLPSQRRDEYLEVLSPLSRARVVRLVRQRSGHYRAVVASEVDSGRKAVILSIRRGSGNGWQIDTVDIGSSTAYWPSL